MKSAIILPLLLLTVGSIPAQSYMEDCLWVASRGATSLYRVTRYGEILQTVDMKFNKYSVRGAWRAPDGKVWVVNFFPNPKAFTILDRNGKFLKNVPTSAGPYAMAFDKKGNAWVSGAVPNGVGKYDSSGKFLGGFTLQGAAPLGITIDSAGNVWVAHRVGPPGMISKIDAKTGKVSAFNLPSTSKILPVHILADFQGFGKPSTIWVGGDDRGDKKLYRFDATGKFLRSYQVFPTGYVTGMAIDRNNDLWVTTSLNEVYKVDAKTGKILLKFNIGSRVGGVTMDAVGRPWVVERSAPSGSEIQRYGLNSTKKETAALVGSNTYGVTDASGYHWAFVVNPFADSDGDGMANVSEIRLGSSPFDPQSTPGLGLEIEGVCSPGSKVDFTAIGSSGVMGVLFGRKFAPGIPFPPVKGWFLLDPHALYPALLFFKAPGKFPISIPKEPSLVGRALKVQGLLAASSGTTFTNTTGIKFIQ